MTKIKDKAEYEVLKERIEELLVTVDNETPEYDKKLIELNLISNLVAQCVYIVTGKQIGRAHV